MGWTTPRTWISAEKPSAATMNTHIRDNLIDLRTGQRASTILTSSGSPTSGTAELVIASSGNVACDGTIPLEIQFSWYHITLSVSSDVFFLHIYDGATAGSGTALGNWRITGTANSGHVRGILTPSAGNHVFTARLNRGSGTGTATLFGSADSPAILTVRPL